MTYLDVISLATAKTYLRIDTDQTETDAEITEMIKGALSFIEKRTGHIMYARDKTYYSDCNLNVYDYPINTTDPSGLIYSTFTQYSPINRELILNVGYINPLDVPKELIQAALQMLKVWYFEAEKQVNTTLIPESVMQALDVNRRFLC